MSHLRLTRKGFYGWLADSIERHPLWLITGTIVLTLLLVLPLVLMPPTEIASDNPTGSDVVKWYEEVQETFPSEVYYMPFVVEAKDGDMLTRDNLYELYRNEQALRESDLSPFLYRRHNEVSGASLDGVFSLADAVDAALRLGSRGMVDLSTATDLQVKQAVDYVLTNPLTSQMEIQLAVQADYEEGPGGVRLWKSPALMFIVESDNEKTKQEYGAAAGQDYSEDYAPEYYGREAQRILRGEQENNRLWGVFIDKNLEIDDEGAVSGPLLMAAIVLMLILVTVLFRSWLITLLSGAGLGMLIIWLKGFSNLIGLKSSTILDLIVPISILVLGLDYAIHALFRYREEIDKGNEPLRALGASIYGVVGAMVLAMLTTIIAFGANAVSGIESIVGFGIAASVAILASFIILGLFVPSLVMLYDRWRGRGFTRRSGRTVSRERGSLMGRIVVATGSKWYIMLPLILIITGAAIWGWTNLETKLDPNDVFDNESDLVVGLDKLDEYVAQKAGESAYLYIKGDFTQPEALDAIEAAIREMEDDTHVARRISDGKPDVYAFIFDYLSAVVQNDNARQRIETASGVTITDVDGDLVPDTQEQLLAVYDYITQEGIPGDADSLLYTPQRIQEAFVHGAPGEDDAALLRIGVPGTREQAIVGLSEAELRQDLDAGMKDAPGIAFYGVTGEAYVRDAQFNAITESMNRSLIIAIAACLLLLLVIFRSLRYAVITLVPVLLVACWLYGFMYIVGYNLNLMTATIAAISIGVGIDFSIHFTSRFRQEMEANPGKKAALFAASRSTGMALFGTAVSTAIGFAVIVFAPMPMFSAFGLLTAVMIVLSFLMALFILPSLLLLVAPSGSKAAKQA